jgi:predicted DNA-binding transcriptional regulator AlpA
MPRQRKSQKQTDKLSSLPGVTPSGLLDTIGAAQWLGVSRTKLFEFMQEEDFPVMRLAERVIRFDPNSLYQWALKRQHVI